MHETLFSYCYSANNGGGVCAVKKYSSYPDYEGRQTIKDEQLYTFTSQYCCFQNCFGFTFGTLTIGSYGSSIYVCSYISNINYSSCVQTDFNFSPSSQSQLAYGAIIDLQATYSNFNSINLTNGQSKYCGGIEMRFTKYETFTFQTLTNISSNYIFSFDCLLDTANITYTNIVSNEIIARDQYAFNPAIIFVKNSSLYVSNTYFMNNKFTFKNGTIVSSEYNEYGFSFNIVNCYFDQSNLADKIYDYIKTKNCYFNVEKTYDADYLKYEECRGDKTPEPLVISSFFTASVEFTKSDFLPSNAFTKSLGFTQSSSFSDSSVFTKSNPFTKSSCFTPSKPFSKTTEFTKTGEFSKTTEFTLTQIFSDSNDFTQSKYFTKSNNFLPTGPFTETSEFTKTGEFSKTTEFNLTQIFSDSNDFTQSKYFTKSNDFLPTSPFSKTTEFTKTGEFSKTTEFTLTQIFSNSNDFTQSKYFTKSNDFLPTGPFIETSEFTKTGEFSKTTEFTLTQIFSDSNNFTQSKYFTKSNDFLPTSPFSKTTEFTKTGEFSKTTEFTLTQIFSDSNNFTQSKYFTKSNDFLPTSPFSKTTEFTKTGGFSKTKDFTFSIVFTESQEFTESQSFSPSMTKKLTKPNEFSETQIFTGSNLFTDSSIFSPSSQFTQSNFIYDQSQVTIQKSLTQILITAKSVSLSYSSVKSMTYSYIMMEDGSYSLTLSEVFVYSNFPYIIIILSPSYIFTNKMVYLNVKKKSLTPEKLIGLICGSVSVFFIGAGTGLFVFRRIVQKNRFVNESTTFSEEYYSENQSEVNFENTQEFDINNINGHDVDSWL